MTDTLGERQLAAIVFTDVSGFSALAGADEEQTLRRVREDLELLGALSSGRKGRIIKSTGDGLLISFGSAVDAVSFAIEAQRRFAERNEKLPQPARLEHRMGIHLGDIFISESEAMGDGVNIAARLQAEAEPGGICISQTVYDVVRNKLSIRAVSLGARELKNIRDAIYAYRVVIDAASGIAGRYRPAPRRRTGVMPAAVMAALLALLVIFAVRGRSRHAALAARQGGAAAPARGLFGAARSARIELIRERLRRRGGEDPLVVRSLMMLNHKAAGRGFREVEVWMEGDDVCIRSESRVTRRRLEQLMPRALAAISAALAREERVKGERAPESPGAEDVRGARQAPESGPALTKNDSGMRENDSSGGVR